MGSDGCSRCGRQAALERGTITDRSGARPVELCARCWREIRRERCHVCGLPDRDGGKAGAIYEDCDGFGYNICDGCRESLLATPRRAA